jgi:hypothetical protein
MAANDRIERSDKGLGRGLLDVVAKKGTNWDGLPTGERGDKYGITTCRRTRPATSTGQPAPVVARNASSTPRPSRPPPL